MAAEERSQAICTQVCLALAVSPAVVLALAVLENVVDVVDVVGVLDEVLEA